MKSIVIYFSQTGNTGKIALAIQAGIIKVTQQCDIAKLKEAEKLDLTHYDLIGIGGPIWRLSAPPNLPAFVRRLPRLDGKHGFPFCTHGTLPIGFMKKMATTMTHQGMTIVGWGDWYGGCFLPHLPKPYMTDGHPDGTDLQEAEEFGKEVARRSQRIYAGETDLIPEMLEGKDADPLWRLTPLAASAVSEARIWTKKNMRINMEKCKYPACTVCIDNCPTNSIDFSVTPPVFRSNCILDFFCESVCPEGAIEADFSRYMVAHDVLVKDLFVRTLNEAEANGKFRRLVPMERVNWNRHHYQITGHPRVTLE